MGGQLSSSAAATASSSSGGGGGETAVAPCSLVAARPGPSQFRGSVSARPNADWSRQRMMHQDHHLSTLLWAPPPPPPPPPNSGRSLFLASDKRGRGAPGAAAAATAASSIDHNKHATSAANELLLCRPNHISLTTSLTSSVHSDSMSTSTGSSSSSAASSCSSSARPPHARSHWQVVLQAGINWGRKHWPTGNGNNKSSCSSNMSVASVFSPTNSHNNASDEFYWHRTRSARKEDEFVEGGGGWPAARNQQPQQQQWSRYECCEERKPPSQEQQQQRRFAAPPAYHELFGDGRHRTGRLWSSTAAASPPSTVIPNVYATRHEEALSDGLHELNRVPDLRQLSLTNNSSSSAHPPPLLLGGNGNSASQELVISPPGSKAVTPLSPTHRPWAAGIAAGILHAHQDGSTSSRLAAPDSSARLTTDSGLDVSTPSSGPLSASSSGGSLSARYSTDDQRNGNATARNANVDGAASTAMKTTAILPLSSRSWTTTTAAATTTTTDHSHHRLKNSNNSNNNNNDGEEKQQQHHHHFHSSTANKLSHQHSTIAAAVHGGVRKSLQASTSELLKGLCTYLVRETVFDDATCLPDSSELVLAMRQVDRSLLLQGWQDIAFISASNVVFVFMLAKRVPRDVKDLKSLREWLLVCLYLSYSYVGNEISYPLKPFLGQQDRHCFWSRCVSVCNERASDMLRINAQSAYFSQLFSELKHYSQFD